MFCEQSFVVPGLMYQVLLYLALYQGSMYQVLVYQVSMCQVMMYHELTIVRVITVAILYWFLFFEYIVQIYINYINNIKMFMNTFELCALVCEVFLNQPMPIYVCCISVLTVFKMLQDSVMIRGRSIQSNRPGSSGSS